MESWEEPLQWIKINEDDKLEIVAETIEKLNEINKELAIIAIAGPYRSGKSHFMNCFSKRPQGFTVSHSTQPETKGIWIWCIEHPLHDNQILVLLDTEGLYDPCKDVGKHALTIFNLGVLLSSTFIYNTTSTIDSKMITDLHFVAAVTENIKAKASQKDDESGNLADITQHLPAFIVAIRDVHLKIMLKDKIVTPDEYFEDVLAYKTGDGRKTDDYNRPRKAIRDGFSSHKCYVFHNAIEKKEIFEGERAKFCKEVLQMTEMKTLQAGLPINGRTLSALAKQYIDEYNLNGVPCIESATSQVIRMENERVTEEAIQMFAEEMKNLEMPVEHAEFKTASDIACYKAMNHFSNVIVNLTCESETSDSTEDDRNKILQQFQNNEYFQTFQLKLEEVENSFILQNERMSKNKCQTLLNNLHEKYIQNENYAMKGGHKKYLNDMKTILEDYDKEPGKGVKAEAVYQKFMQDRADESARIKSADQQLDEKDKQIQEKEEQNRALLAENAVKEEQLQNEKLQAKILEEAHQKALKIKEELYEKQLREEIKRLEKMINRNVEMQNLLTNNATRECSALRDTIDGLKKDKEIYQFLLIGIGQIAASHVLPRMLP